MKNKLISALKTTRKMIKDIDFCRILFFEVEIVIRGKC